jgi:hypothetical protein
MYCVSTKQAKYVQHRVLVILPRWSSYFHTLTAPSLLADINLWLDKLKDANASIVSRWHPAESAAAKASCVLGVKPDTMVVCLYISWTEQ